MVAIVDSRDGKSIETEMMQDIFQMHESRFLRGICTSSEAT
jgi:hypothetical protein